MSIPVLIIGAGGHAKVVASTLLAQGQLVMGFCDVNPAMVGRQVLGLPVLGGDEVLGTIDPSSVRLANGLGGTPTGSRSGLLARARLEERIKGSGFTFVSAIHPTAVLAVGVRLLGAAQLMAHSTVQPDVSVGDGVVVNTNASVDHDCILGDFSFIGPGATLCGGVTLGAHVFIGAGAVVLPNVVIGEGSVVAGGATLRKNIAPQSTYTGQREIPHR